VQLAGARFAEETLPSAAEAILDRLAGNELLRCFDAQDDHSAQPLLTHSDRTASATGAITRRTEELHAFEYCCQPPYWSSKGATDASTPGSSGRAALATASRSKAAAARDAAGSGREWENCCVKGGGRAVGRDAELAAVGEGLRADAPHLVVICGEAGIGKTTVWEAALERASAAGFRALVARPTESESQLAYSALNDVLADVLDELLPELPPPRAHAASCPSA
jgi:hypothetical protein